MRTYKKERIILVLLLTAIICLPNSWLHKIKTKINLLSVPIWKKISYITTDVVQQEPIIAPRFSQEEKKYAIASVIYRDRQAWFSYAWIDQGSSTGIIKKNSPVVYGNDLIGVVEEVYSNCARIRLITDENLHPYVYIQKSSTQQKVLRQQIQQLLESLSSVELQGINKQHTIQTLHTIASHLEKSSMQEKLFLGTVSGQHPYSWKKNAACLIGNDFHCISSSTKVEQGDMLVTSGLDGIFPEGLKVGYIKTIGPMTQEGTYTFQALPSSYLDLLKQVYILPPLMELS